MVFDPAKAREIETGITDIYSRAELYLIRILRDAIIQAGKSDSWQHAQLLAIRQQKYRIMGVAQVLQRESPKLWEELVHKAFLVGQIEAEKELLPIPVIDPAETVLDASPVYAIAAEQLGVMTTLHRNILRATDDIWRKITAEATGYALTGVMTEKQAAQRAFTRMAREGFPFFVDKAGRKWGLDTYAEMAVRNATVRAMRTGHQATYIQHGIDLVVVSSHKNPAPQCAPFERKILSLTGKYPAGTHRIGDNIVRVKATMADAEAAGLHHINCAHTHAAFVPGYTRVKHEEWDGDDSGYKATQKQRYYERQIRASKRMEEAAVTDEDSQKAKQRKRQYQAKLRDHITEHDLPRRREREQLMKPAKGAVGVEFRDGDSFDD